MQLYWTIATVLCWFAAYAVAAKLVGFSTRNRAQAVDDAVAAKIQRADRLLTFALTLIFVSVTLFVLRVAFMLFWRTGAVS